MDSSIWIPAVFSLVATVVGGGLSILASVVTQRQQADAARQLSSDQRAESVADLAIQEIYALKEHAQLEPRDTMTGWPEWESTLKSRTSRLRTTLLRLRHRELRDRLMRTMTYLDLAAVIAQPVWGGRPSLAVELCDHAIDALGAFVRDEPLPAPTDAFATAAAVELTWLANSAASA